MTALPAPSAPADAAADTLRSAAAAPRRGLPWPAPALLAWLASWCLAWVLLAAAVPPLVAWASAASACALAALLLVRASGWRRLIVAAGFPVSALASGAAAAVPAWAWLLPLALLLAAYPLRAWRDAPLFPTPADALAGLAAAVPLPPGARLMDAGCGLGHGLAALRRAYPQAMIEGVEWSWPLRLAAALRCPWARVRQGDMWAADWSGLALVYLFQRPESMARALAKAQAEMAPGSWLASLDFMVPGVAPTTVLRRPGRQPVWLYRLGEADPHARVPGTGRRPGSTRRGPGR